MGSQEVLKPEGGSRKEKVLVPRGWNSGIAEENRVRVPVSGEPQDL